MKLYQNLAVELLKKYGGMDSVSVVHLTEPPDREMGDICCPCFPLAKVLRKKPNEIAVELVKKLEPHVSSCGAFRDVRAVGPYVNFFIDREHLYATMIPEILKSDATYGSAQTGSGKTVLVEFSSCKSITRSKSISFSLSTSFIRP